MEDARERLENVINQLPYGLMDRVIVRLAKVLLWLSQDCHVNGKAKLKIVHKELAWLTGCSRENATYCLLEFRELGWVSCQRGVIEVDIEKVEGFLRGRGRKG